MNHEDEDDVTWLEALYREIVALSKKGFTDLQLPLTEVAREVTQFVLDVGGVVVADVASRVKAFAKRLGIEVEWVMPTIAEISITIEEIFTKKIGVT